MMNLKHIALALFLAFSLLISPAACFANDNDDLQKIFQDLKVGEPLPDLKYVYLPEKLPDGRVRYEGFLGELKFHVFTQRNDKDEEIVKTLVFTPNKRKEEWLGILISNFGKPTEKSGSTYTCKNVNDGWMLILMSDSTILMRFTIPNIGFK